MIKFVFLDLDNTLLDFDWAERNALSQTLVALGVEPREEILDRYHAVNLSQWKRLEQREITRDEVKTGRYRILFDEFGINADPQEATDIYESYLCRGHRFVEGAPELLAALQREAYQLYLVSNGAWRVQEGRLQSAGITTLFDGIFVSETVGVEKPATAFFDAVFAQIDGFSRERAVIIGDSLTSDMQGGANAGIKTIWFNRRGEQNNTSVRPDYKVASHSEIPSLLKSL